MSIYGALYAGVSGLKGQSTKIGVISDNIANVNTVGYKGGTGIFQSLVTGSGASTIYSPGGVLGRNRQLISRQGLLQATDSPTDIAISGGGFFVVNQAADQSGQVFYTRAGSFIQDSTGNFRNAAGFFLQAWPLDREGRLPGEPGNLDTSSTANLSSLRTVNVQNLAGSASATTAVSLGATLNAGQAAFPGAAGTLSPHAADANNFGISATELIIPQPAGTIDRLTRGDQFTVTTGAGLSYTYTYGGFTFSRVVTSGAAGDDGVADLGDGETVLGLDPFTSVGGGSAVVVVTNAGHGLQTGDVVEFSDVTTDVGDILASELTGKFVITRIDANSYSIVSNGTDGGAASTGGGTPTEDIRPFADAGNILDAATATQAFLGTTGTTGFTTAALSFTINTDSFADPAVFTYSSSASPNTQEGEFNNLTTLAEAISLTSGLTARVVGGRLYVGALNANDSLTFANGSEVGDSGPPVQAGIDWIGELGLANVASDNGRFSTLQGLTDLVNESSGLSATISDPLDATELAINVDDPLDTITFEDEGTNTGSIVAALGLVDSLAGAAFTAQNTGALGPAYDAGTSSKNMASGAISPQFTRPIQIYDSLGARHDITVMFLKTEANTWAVELVVSEDDVSSSVTDGLVASGTITFNGNGSLRSVSTGLTQAVDINWINGATASSVTFNWGTAGQPFGTPNASVIGDTDGLSQFNTDYAVNFVNQNGAAVGSLERVLIDENGFIIASYSNGETQLIYKIPLANFPNPDSLLTSTGNVFSQTSDSGEVNLREAGSNGVGKIASSSLETSNVELANELTDMIITQRAYQASTKIIQTADDLLEQLNQITR